ncbi:hypothetical protein C7B65_15440 [Phormidesmis priestleyi ULC007]|uniref:YbjN domain-containing protein n=1 Tax=Phormidesmis priestleyi ULC007 TaxID=1920490 RepID=A0A2T1DDD2_9CYAN|nr:hypothetical protein [Phormidesmis priestleyi]PSB18485.1 hypothetical protein C7B65_15440 [Phormidesmis priestleyi ULC007]PZO48788.1 MAG: hypothetical protein DCF14_15750 [Phormidesmis priestleyi]
MGATLEQIAGFLDNKDWKYRLDPEESRILTGVYGENIEDFLIVIQLDEDGEFFEIFAPRVLAGVKDHPHKTAILQTMLCISWETKMLQWEYDPSDGEIRAIIEFPLEDAILTERQFYRCLHSLVQLVDELAMPRLQAVMETGEDPGDLEEGERLLLALQEEAPGLLTVLERAMEARKRRGRHLPEKEPDKEKEKE